MMTHTQTFNMAQQKNQCSASISNDKQQHNTANQIINQEITQNQEQANQHQKPGALGVLINLSEIMLPTSQKLPPKLSSQRLSIKKQKYCIKSSSINKLLSISKQPLIQSSISQTIEINQLILKRIEQKIYPLNKDTIKKIRLKKEFLNSSQKPKKNINQSSPYDSTKKITKNSKTSSIHAQNLPIAAIKKSKKCKRTKKEQQIIELQQRVQKYLITKRKQLILQHQYDKENSFFQKQQEITHLKRNKRQRTLISNTTVNDKCLNDMHSIFLPKTNIENQIQQKSLLQKSKKTILKHQSHGIKTSISSPESEIKNILNLFKEKKANLTTIQVYNYKTIEQDKFDKIFNRKVEIQQKSKQKIHDKNESQEVFKHASFQYNTAYSSTFLLKRRQGIKANDFESTLENLGDLNNSDIKNGLATLKSLKTCKSMQKQNQTIKKIIKQIPSNFKILANVTESSKRLDQELVTSIVDELLDQKNNLMRKRINQGKLTKNRKYLSILGTITG